MQKLLIGTALLNLVLLGMNLYYAKMVFSLVSGIAFVLPMWILVRGMYLDRKDRP